MIYDETLNSDFRKAIKALTLLHASGYDAYLVGGCVRALLMGMTPSDYDLATDATVENIAEVFRKYSVYETGIKYGTLTVVVDELPLQITTYRTESEYSDNRHPDSVEFTTNLIED